MLRPLSRLIPVTAALCLLAIAGAVLAGPGLPGDEIAYVLWDNEATDSAVMLHDLRRDVAAERFRVFGRIDDLAWSPDGETLLFAAFRGEELRRDLIALNVRSGAWAWITDGPADHNTPDFSPDGTRLAVQRRSGAERPTWDIALMDAATGTVERVALHTRSFNEGRPSWSPDGTRIAYQATGGATNIPRLRVLEVASGTVLFEALGTMPAWSPSGDRLAYIGSLDGSDRSAPGDGGAGILMMTLTDATRQGRVSRVDVPRLIEAYPAWSPDGERLLFTGFVTASREVHIYSVRPDGGDLRQITAGPGIRLYPVWRPR